MRPIGIREISAGLIAIVPPAPSIPKAARGAHCRLQADSGNLTPLNPTPAGAADTAKIDHSDKIIIFSSGTWDDTNFHAVDPRRDPETRPPQMTTQGEAHIQEGPRPETRNTPFPRTGSTIPTSSTKPLSILSGAS